MKPLPILARRQSDDAEKDFPEGARIGITDLPRYTLHRQLTELKKLLRLGDAQSLGIVGCGQPGDLLEPAQEGPLFEAGLVGQNRQPRLLAFIGLQEMLRLEDRGVTMIQTCTKPL